MKVEYYNYLLLEHSSIKRGDITCGSDLMLDYAPNFNEVYHRTHWTLTPRVYLVQISKASGVSITHVGVGTCQEASHSNCEGGCWVRMSLDDGFTLIDANTSAVVGPQLGVHTGCGCTPNTAPSTCTPHTCLNGGRCMPTPASTRCVLHILCECIPFPLLFDLNLIFQ